MTIPWNRADVSSPPSHSAAFRPLQPPRNLTRTLIERISAEVLDGTLAPGAKLPTEPEMMAALGVSRTVVREAVAALRAEGLVVTRQGVGAFVTSDVQRRPFRIDPDGLHSLAEVINVMELRTGVEVEAAGIAAERASAEAVRSIGQALKAVDRAIRRDEAAVDEDFAFHRAIADATGNPQFARFHEFLGRFIIPRQSVRAAHGRMADQRAYLEMIQAEHRAIHDAIRQRQPQPARLAMRRHLENSRKRYRKLADAGPG